MSAQSPRLVRRRLMAMHRRWQRDIEMLREMFPALKDSCGATNIDAIFETWRNIGSAEGYCGLVAHGASDEALAEWVEKYRPVPTKGETP